MEVDKRIDDRRADSPPHVRIAQFRGLRVSDDHAAATLHQIEGGVDDADIVAEKVRPGCEWKHRVQRAEPAILTRHVVRRRRHRSEGRTTEHELGAAVSHEIGQVGVPAGKLLNLECA
jgi:hypothetical protein